MKRLPFTLARVLLTAALFAQVVLLGAEAAPASAIVPVPGTPAQREARSAWWREARFGPVLPWGLHAILARGEWVQWIEQIPNEECARPAAESKGERFDAAARRDLLADHVKAMRGAGRRVGVCYSPLDWRFPGFNCPGVYRSSAEALCAQYHRQRAILLTDFGPLDVSWFDGGPRPDGTIDPAHAARLREIGAWLARSGESTYRTRGGPFLPGDYGDSTHRDNLIDVHVFQWAGRVLTLPALPARVRQASRVDGGGVSFVQNDRGLQLTVPAGADDAIDTISKLEPDRPAAEIAPLSAIGQSRPTLQ